MPKSQIVEPAEERKAGSIPFAEIPLNQYQQDLAKEKEAYRGYAPDTRIRKHASEYQDARLL
jgi:hypothetical protein